jgi:hypothetical protein
MDAPSGTRTCKVHLANSSDTLHIASNQLSLHSNCNRDSHIARTCQTFQLQCYLNQSKLDSYWFHMHALWTSYARFEHHPPVLNAIRPCINAKRPCENAKRSYKMQNARLFMWNGCFFVWNSRLCSGTQTAVVNVLTPVVNAMRLFWAPHARFERSITVCTSETAVSMCETAVYFRKNRRPLFWNRNSLF